MRSELSDVAQEGIKMAPPVGVTALSVVGGLTLQEWVYVLTAIYTALMIVNFVYEKWIKPWLTKRRKR